VFRGKGLSFKAYLPDKPAKYGFLFKCLGDAEYAYIYRSNVYAGKPAVEGGEYYIQGEPFAELPLGNTDTSSFVTVSRIRDQVVLDPWIRGPGYVFSGSDPGSDH